MQAGARTTRGSAVAESSIVVARARLATFDASSEPTSDAMFDATSEACQPLFIQITALCKMLLLNLLALGAAQFAERNQGRA